GVAHQRPAGAVGGAVEPGHRGPDEPLHAGGVAHPLGEGRLGVERLQVVVFHVVAVGVELVDGPSHDDTRQVVVGGDGDERTGGSQVGLELAAGRHPAPVAVVHGLPRGYVPVGRGAHRAGDEGVHAVGADHDAGVLVVPRAALGAGPDPDDGV